MVIDIDGICGIYLRIFNKQVFLLYVSCGKFNCAFRTIVRIILIRRWVDATFQSNDNH